MPRRANRVTEAVGLAVAEGLGIAVVGFLGAELMLAPAGATLSTLEGLALALAAGIGAGLYRFNRYVPHPAPVEQPEPTRVAQSAAAGRISPGNDQRPVPVVSQTARRPAGRSPSTELVIKRGAWSRR